jgi:hypothetical protein
VQTEARVKQAITIPQRGQPVTIDDEDLSEGGIQVMGLPQLCEPCGPLRALRKKNPLEKERYVGAKLAKDRKVRKEAHQPR